MRLETRTSLEKKVFIAIHAHLKFYAQRDIDTLYPLSQRLFFLLFQPFTLEGFRSKEQKLELLDTALQTHDGNAIIAVSYLTPSLLYTYHLSCFIINTNPVYYNPCPDDPGHIIFKKQCRSKSAGFIRSQLIWIHTDFFSACESIAILLDENRNSSSL